jgi:hypothetical protein
MPALICRAISSFLKGLDGCFTSQVLVRHFSAEKPVSDLKGKAAIRSAQPPLQL